MMITGAKLWATGIVTMTIFFQGCFPISASHKSIEQRVDEVSASNKHDMEEGFKLILSSDWMRELGDTRLMDIQIIPGSHNSASAKPRNPEDGPGYEFFRQQELSILDQLNSGVRLIDLRLRYQSGPVEAIRAALRTDKTESHIRVSHSFDSSYVLEHALDEIRHFLGEHAGEVVLLMVRGDWPPEKHFSRPDQKEERVGEVAQLLNKSGLSFVRRSNLDPQKVTLGSVAGQVILISDWLQEDPNDSGKDLLKDNGIEYIPRSEFYKVCDAWNDKSVDDSLKKIDQLMTDTDREFDASRRRKPVDEKDCTTFAFHGSALFTGIGLDHSSITAPPCVTSKNWIEWFISNLETNTKWNPNVPIGIVLIDFTNPFTIKRLLDVGFNRANMKVRVQFPIEWAKGLDLHCAFVN